MSLSPRLTALTKMDLAYLREYSGLHEYDGEVADLSPSGIRSGLAALGGAAEADEHDDKVLGHTENAMRVRFGSVEQHRRDPHVHIEALDLTMYDREYAPVEERQAARTTHLAAWPDVVDAALESLDMVSVPAAKAMLTSARGLGSAVTSADGASGERALSALGRMVGHLEKAAEFGDPDPMLGRELFTELITCEDGLDVDLAKLTARAEAETERLTAMLREAVSRAKPGIPTDIAVAELMADHGTAEEIYLEGQQVADEAEQFVKDRDLVPYTDGHCLVGPTPPARRWGPGRVSWSAPWEQPAPAWFHITPPEPDWSPRQADLWLQRFSHTTLPVMIVHEVAPGHCSNALAMRHAATDVRKTLWSELFFEGWAHYSEELCLDEGFRSEDPRFAAGVAIEGLIRTTRLRCAIGLHTGSMTVDEAIAEFEQHAYLGGKAAQAEALRGTFEPTYIRYTWGKFLMQDIRDKARATWGSDYSTSRFHRELLALGSPPMSLVAPALGLD